MGAIDPIVLEVALEIGKAILGVLVPALTIALTFYTNRLNHKLKMKTLKDEIEKLAGYAEESQMFKLMDRDQQRDTLLDSMKTFVMANDINVSQAELQLLVERALMAKTNLKMRFMQLDEKGK